MESSLPKRRKLSPTASIALDAFNTEQPPSSRDGRPPSASFMSPTKSSLSRFNPNLLPRPKSSGEGAEIGDDNLYRQLGRTDGPMRSKGLNPIALRPTTPNRGDTRQSVSPGRHLSVSPRRAAKSPGSGMSAAPRRMSRGPTPIRAFSPTKTLRRSPVQIAPASPPEEAREVEFGDTSVKLGLEPRADARPSSAQIIPQEMSPVSQQVDNGEPELPLTPTHLGLEPKPSPPKGLLSSSPSRRTGRKKRRKNGEMKSSPLKPRDGPMREGAYVVQGTITAEEREAVEKAREETQPADPEIATKRQTLEQLSLQLAALQSDVAVLTRHVQRAQSPSGTSDPEEDLDKLVSILISSNPTHAPLPSRSLPISLTKRLTSFLPFASRRHRPPSAPAILIPSTPLPSHHPLPISNTIPYLKAFTPFTLTSTTRLIPSSPPLPLLRQDTLTLTSPDQNLHISFALTLDPNTETITALSLLSLSPWANPELGAWLHTHISSCDINTLATGCTNFWTLALIRASCWQNLYNRFPHLLSSVLPTTMHNSTPSQTRHSKRLYLSHSSLLFTQPSPPPSISTSPSSPPTPEKPNPKLRISWSIHLDWTGEIISDLSATALFPKRWQEHDERGSLKLVSAIFDKLVRRRGVESAVEGLVGIVFGGRV